MHTEQSAYPNVEPNPMSEEAVEFEGLAAAFVTQTNW